MMIFSRYSQSTRAALLCFVLRSSFMKRPGAIFGSAIFLVLRYVLIGVAIYAMIEGLGITPGALIVGLLVSFAALVLELLWGAVGPK